MTSPAPKSADHSRHSLIAWLVDCFKSTPFKALSTAALAFGCFLLVPFFWDLGELPQLDISSMLPLLATIAIGGFALTFFLVAMPVAGGLLARSGPNAPSWQSDWCSLLIYAAPSVGFSFLLGASLHQFDFWETAFGYAGGPVVFSGAFLAAARVWTLRRSILDRTARISAWAMLAWNSIVQTALTAYLVITSVIIVAAESQTEGELDATIVLWTLYAAVVAVLAVRIKALEVVRIMLVVAFVVAILLMVGTGEMTSISKTLLKKTGWGNYPAKLFVTDRGCDLLNRSTGRVVCKIEKTEGGNLVCPAIVRSRIGTPNFLAISPFTSAGNWPNREKAFNVSLPKEDVIVWQRIVELTKSKQPMGSRDTQNPATRLVSPGGEQERWVTDQCGPMPGQHSANSAP